MSGHRAKRREQPLIAQAIRYEGGIRQMVAALDEINRDCLYRGTHANFKEYVVDRFGAHAWAIWRSRRSIGGGQL